MKPSEKPIDRIDQFFKNKLDDHTMAPSENAWAKVEAGLSKKNNVVLWRWAAAVFLMGALITSIYWSQRSTESPEPVLAAKKIEKAEPNSILTDKSKMPQQRTESTVAQNNGANADKKSSAKDRVHPATIKSLEIQKQETVAVVDDNKQPVIKEGIHRDEEKIKVEATSTSTVASSQQKPIKLEFTLEDLPSAETVATTDENKNTGLKKVLELAREMKQGEGPLSNLKEKKNELFAHTLSREKKDLDKLN